MDRIDMKRTTPDHEDFRGLIHLLDQELLGRYGEEQQFFDVYNILDSTTRVVLLYHNGVVIGCGGFRPMDKEGEAEIKRMYIRPGYRGKGFALTILKALEAWAHDEGFTTFLLETGVKQPDALKAYQHAGYTTIENYGPYKKSTYSICMRKDLKNRQ